MSKNISPLPTPLPQAGEGRRGKAESGEGKTRAVILLSGGLDSATALAIAKSQGYDIYALSFAYGQRHFHELSAAQKIAAHYGVREHRVLTFNLGEFGGSALTQKDIEVPKDRLPPPPPPPPQAGGDNKKFPPACGGDVRGGSIPITYVPARNTIFLSFALAWAEVLKAYDIFIGVNALDYSGYPDCRPEFIRAFEEMANLATAYVIPPSIPPLAGGIKGGKRIKIHTPLISLTKAEIIKKGLELGVDYALTSSCYDPDKQGTACGHCDSCQLRKKGFEEAGVLDPIRYAA